jgi:hypothetical protein
MRMNADLDDEPITRSDLHGYFHPREIVADHSVPTARRRAMLAYWLSDANAVGGTPGLRNSGWVTTTVGELRSALSALDEIEAMMAAQAAGTPRQTAA